MKKVTLLILLVVAALILGCAGQKETPKATPAETPTATATPEYTLVNPGYLTVGSDIAYPPFEYTDEKTGEYVGFDIDLMTEIAKRMGLEAKFINQRKLGTYVT
ncbi:hypothetical protein DRO97_05205 [Archaeoglobales archaeon]|nr:MAG: hypothetical protein DRO97_05205 [Archaeoglobales archaeon]